MKPREKLAALRREMAAHEVDAYLVPSTDPHQSEYVPERWQRRQWLSGFTGSAGELVVTAAEAALWTDGRYFLQAPRQLRGSGIRLMRSGEKGVPPLERYVAEKLGRGTCGVDPRTLTPARCARIRKAFSAVGAEIRFLEENLVDRIWTDQPAPSEAPLLALPASVTGESAAAKLRRVRKILRERNVAALVLGALDEIAWVLNVRGNDIAYNPLAVAYAIVTTHDAHVFIDPAKVPPAVEKKLGPNVRIRPYAEVSALCRELGASNVRVWCDESAVNAWIASELEGAVIVPDRSPIGKMKAKKNDVEIQGTRGAHVRDGVAMVRFLHWLDGNVRRGGVTEISAARQLEAFRAENDRYRGPSFETISGYGAHGAIVHYAVDERTDVPLRPAGLYLVDSGGHYLDGTTDITRTVLLGKRATKEQRERFTRVLRGHIALARVVFPANVDGVRLDVLARLPLWESGLEYGHGTGHGVGSYMNVHEGPQGIGSRCSEVPLEPGNLLSNEPGYYKEGAYGIRIENLILVVDAPDVSRNGTRWHRFETVTLCPIDTRLVDRKLLTPDERRWLNAYHARVLKTLSPELEPGDRRWLRGACAAV